MYFLEIICASVLESSACKHEISTKFRHRFLVLEISVLILFCLQPLDRDPPNGYETWQILIAADDEDGNSTSVRSLTEVYITLTDINDNAPYLDIVSILSNSGGFCVGTCVKIPFLLPAPTSGLERKSTARSHHQAPRQGQRWTR